jgi:hypothetical protein
LFRFALRVPPEVATPRAANCVLYRRPPPRTAHLSAHFLPPRASGHAPHYRFGSLDAAAFAAKVSRTPNAVRVMRWKRRVPKFRDRRRRG